MRNKEGFMDGSFINSFIFVYYFALELILVGLEIMELDYWHIFIILEENFSWKRKGISPYSVEYNIFIFVHILSESICFSLLYFSFVYPPFFEEGYFSPPICYIISYLSFIELYVFLINDS